MSNPTVQDYLSDEKWCKKIDNWFRDVDRDKNGFVTRKEWFVSVDKLEELLPDRKDFITVARQRTNEYLDSLQLTEGLKADKQKFRELSASYAMREGEIFKRGEFTTLEKLMHAMFDVLDTNSNGYLSFDEYKVLAASYNNDDENSAKATFALLDKNNDGRLDKKEYASSLFKFSMMLDDKPTEGLLGERY